MDRIYSDNECHGYLNSWSVGLIGHQKRGIIKSFHELGEGLTIPSMRRSDIGGFLTPLNQGVTSPRDKRLI